jgi:parallel beta-helix repeat protein
VKRSVRLRRSRGLFAAIIAVSALVVSVGSPVLGSSDRALAATAAIRIVGNCTGATYTTIQSAVNAAADGDTIQVCLGTYPEQVVIGKNNLTLQSQTPYSQTSPGATIQAPPALPATQQSAIVHVAGVTGVTITGFTIRGPGTTNCGSIGYGVLVDGGGSAIVTENHITAIRDNPPLSGCQNGHAIGAGLTNPNTGATSPGSVNATGNRIDDYQKGGINVRGVGSVNMISGNTIVGAGPTPAIGQNAIQISRSASATVTGNTISGSAYSGPQNVSATGILVFGPIGDVLVSQNTVLRSDIGIGVFSVATNTLRVRDNTVTAGDYGIYVDTSSNVRVENNTVVGPEIFGVYAGTDARGNTFQNNRAGGTTGEGHYDCRDRSNGSETAGTANTWTGNTGDTRAPEGICSLPLVIDVPPVIVLPLEPGAGPPTTGGPVAERAANHIVARMRNEQLRTCLIEVRSVGSGRVLVARGIARAPARGGGRLILKVGIRPQGKKLLTKHFGGVVVDVRALCRSTLAAHRRVKRVRAVLVIEHVVTPPGSWVPDHPILLPKGVRFVQRLQQRMIQIRAIRCDGYTATYIPSPMDPPTLSMQRAAVVCGLLKRAGVTVRPRLYAHGRANPIATNANEAGMRQNRRVAVTFVHPLLRRP